MKIHDFHINDIFLQVFNMGINYEHQFINNVEKNISIFEMNFKELMYLSTSLPFKFIFSHYYKQQSLNIFSSKLAEYYKFNELDVFLQA